METSNKQTNETASQPGVVNYAALRQYNRYGRGRSMKKFCEKYVADFGTSKTLLLRPSSPPGGGSWPD